MIVYMRSITPHLRAKSRLRRLRSETRLRAQWRGSAKQGFPRGEAVKIGSSEPILTDEECGQKS